MLEVRHSVENGEEQWDLLESLEELWLVQREQRPENWSSRDSGHAEAAGAQTTHQTLVEPFQVSGNVV